ncbi:Poly(U)-binding-splicing factor puf60 [Physocladia obscura]|uniref:Poly(U)-binding-splicing factor puf60 n=1 Tax=Physocladia obscura TaxID=109957 RepID=A0AAD5XIS5_9FUNG|nr:Poly(U)-binding-splicing factor puf60 [Physocladia obscura]
MEALSALDKAKAFARAQSVKLVLHNANANPASDANTGGSGSDSDSTPVRMDTLTPARIGLYASALQYPPGAEWTPSAVAAAGAASKVSFLQMIEYAALKIHLKIYVGAMHAEMTEAHLRLLFAVFGPIRALAMSFDQYTGWGPAKHKGFAFLEFFCPESASLAIEFMHGVEFGSRPMKVCRPKDYLQGPFPQQAVGENANDRVFVANVHEHVDEDMLCSIFESFGQPDPITRKHRGCGYIQFATASAASTAVTSIRSEGGFELAGSRLNAILALVGGPMMPGMQGLAEIPDIPEDMKVAANLVISGKMAQQQLQQQQLQQSAAAVAAVTQYINMVPGGGGSSIALPPKPAPLQSDSAAALAIKAAISAAKAKMARENPGMAVGGANGDGAIDDDATMAINSHSKRYDVMQKLMRPEDRVGGNNVNDASVVAADGRAAVKRRKIIVTVSRVLILRNMVTASEAREDKEGIEEEIREECSRYGTVESVNVVGSVAGGESLGNAVGSNSYGDQDEETTVDVKVVFGSEEDAGKALAVLDGR